MKAWIVTTDYDTGCTVVFAETRGKAIAAALCCDQFEDCEFIEIRATRFKKFDSHYRGRSEIDWYDPKDRVPLVRDYSWACDDIGYDCDTCAAKKWCMHWEDRDNAEYGG